MTNYTSSNSWDVAAGFTPNGFQPDDRGWANGTTIGLYLGGTAGTDGARATSSGGRPVYAVRVPEGILAKCWRVARVGGEFPNPLRQPTPVSYFVSSRRLGATRQVSGKLTSATPGPMFPLPWANFERPYIVLGGLANSTMRDTSGTTVVSGAEQTRFASPVWAWISMRLAAGGMEQPLLR